MGSEKKGGNLMEEKRIERREDRSTWKRKTEQLLGQESQKGKEERRAAKRGISTPGNRRKKKGDLVARDLRNKSISASPHWEGKTKQRGKRVLCLFHFLLVRFGVILPLRGGLMGNWTDQRKRKRGDWDPMKEIVRKRQSWKRGKKEK